jgi:hypothetical protein
MILQDQSKNQLLARPAPSSDRATDRAPLVGLPQVGVHEVVQFGNASHHAASVRAGNLVVNVAFHTFTAKKRGSDGCDGFSAFVTAFNRSASFGVAGFATPVNGSILMLMLAQSSGRASQPVSRTRVARKTGHNKVRGPSRAAVESYENDIRYRHQ